MVTNHTLQTDRLNVIHDDDIMSSILTIWWYWNTFCGYLFVTEQKNQTDFLNVNNANVLLYKVSNKKWDILLLLQVVHPTFFGNTL